MGGTAVWRGRGRRRLYVNSPNLRPQIDPQLQSRMKLMMLGVVPENPIHVTVMIFTSDQQLSIPVSSFSCLSPQRLRRRRRRRRRCPLPPLRPSQPNRSSYRAVQLLRNSLRQSIFFTGMFAMDWILGHDIGREVTKPDSVNLTDPVRYKTQRLSDSDSAPQRRKGGGRGRGGGRAGSGGRKEL